MVTQPHIVLNASSRGSPQESVVARGGSRPCHKRRPRVVLTSVFHYLLVAALLVSLAGSQGCAYNYRVQVTNPTPATEYQRKTVNNFWWGLSPDPSVVTSNCVRNAIDEVHVETNFGYLLLSVVTLGIWVPLDVEWTCAKCADENQPAKPIGQ